MPPSLLPSATTLIVATTPPPALGIGKNLTLPWPRLSSEMSYFARVTKRVPSASPNGTTFVNAVVMGRKTWDSIPARFRPLPNRINVIVSRSSKGSEAPQDDNTKNEFWVNGIEEGVRLVRRAFSPLASSTDEERPRRILHRIFVIGGAEIYRSALRLPKDAEGYPTRILHTTVLEPEFECDTFFPSPTEEGGRGGEEWKDAGLEELVEFTGEEETFLKGVKEENGVKYQFGMMRR